MANAPAYQPRWTKGQPGGSDILDRNLREIATALAAAFGTIQDLRTTILNITSGGTTTINNAGSPAIFPPGLEMIGAGDESDAFMGPPGRDGRQGIDGRPGFGMDGDPGEDGLAGPPGAAGAAGATGATGAQGPTGLGIHGYDGDDGMDGLIVPGPTGAAGAAGAPGTNGISGVPGPSGSDGEDGLDGGARMDFSGLPLGAMPAEFDTTGDVMRAPNGDSRIRGQDGIYYYSRVVAGPYSVSFGTLTIEDNAILMVL